MNATPPKIAFQEIDRSTHFLFEHKVFQLKGARFAFTGDRTEPAFHMDLGTLNVAIRLPAMRSEFGIAPESPDGTLLKIVERSLRFVEEIRPGDSIPREILDGTASWSVEDRHRLRAKARLWLKALCADESILRDDAALQHFMDDPETKTRFGQAARELAGKLALGGGEVVAERIDALARELCYVEALREKCGLVLAIVPKVNHLARVYRGDRAVVDELSRIRTLLFRPIEEYDTIYQQLDGVVGDIVAALRGLEHLVGVIRAKRDDLHESMMMWEPVIQQWQKLELVRHSATEAAVAELYRFTARHYGPRQHWHDD